MGYSFVRFLAFLVVKLVAKVEVEGWDNVPQTGSYIAAANHLGRLEVILVFYLLNRRDIILIVAEKYRSSRFWSWFVRRVDGIFIDRYNADFSALREVLKRLSKGHVLFIAPEGTRSKTGYMAKANSGAAYLASKSGVMVLPAGVAGTEDMIVFPNVKRLRRSQVHLRIGKPYIIPPLKGHNREAQLEEYTEDLMCRIAAMLPEKNRGYYADHPGLNKYLNEA